MTSEKVNELNELAKQLEDQFSAEPKSYFYYAEVYRSESSTISVSLSGVIEYSQRPALAYKKMQDHLYDLVKEELGIGADGYQVIIKQFNTL